MNNPTGDLGAGAPRLRRERLSRKDEQAHVREVLAALGGSPEQLDREHDRSDEPSNLGSRIGAYSRLASAATATAPTAAAPAATPRGAVRRPDAVPRSVRRNHPGVVIALAHALRGVAGALVRSAIRALRLTARLLPHVARALVLALSHVAAVLKSSLSRVRDALTLFARLVVRAVRKLAGTLLRTAAALGRARLPALHKGARSARSLPRAGHRLALPPRAATLKRTPRPVRRREPQREPAHVAETVIAWVQPQPERSEEPVNRSTETDAHGGDPEPDVPRKQAPALDDESSRSWTGRASAAFLAVVLVVVGAAVLVPRQLHHHDAAPTRSTAAANITPQAVPSRVEFSDPRKYGAAMTRFALTSGQTAIDGQVACDQNSTWDRWSCQARGKPSLGAYAGVWLTYRCSPSSTPQPGGRPAAAMINCKPVSPPSASAGKPNPAGNYTATVTPAGPYVFGESVYVKTNAPLYANNLGPYISMTCYQNGTLVLSGSHAGFPAGYTWPLNLGPTLSWKSGPAKCTARVFHLSHNKNITDALASFSVSA